MVLVLVVLLFNAGHVNVEEVDVEELVVPLDAKSGHVKVDELGLEVVELSKVATQTFKANIEMIRRWLSMMISKYQVTYCRFQIVISAFEVNGILLFCCWGNSGFLFDDKKNNECTNGLATD